MFIINKLKSVFTSLLYIAIFGVLAVLVTLLFKSIGITDNNLAVISYKILTVVFLYVIFLKRYGSTHLLNPHMVSLSQIKFPCIYSFFCVIAVLSSVLLLIVNLSSLNMDDVFRSYDLFSPLMFSTVIIAPITEEILFRGAVFNELKKNFSIKWTLVIQAVLFGLIHVNPIQVAYTTIFGLILGIIYVRTKSLSTAIISHMVINFTGTYLLSKIYYNTPRTFFFGVIILSVLMTLILSFYNTKKRV